MLQAFLCLAGFLGAMPGPASAARIDQEAFGCQSMANATQLLTLRQATGLTNYDTHLQKAGSGRRMPCVDHTVTVEDESDGLVCLAPSDMRRSCYWSAPEAGRPTRP